jgi:hypothetical protein
MTARVSIARIKAVVAADYGVPLDAIDTHRRFKAFVEPRHVAMYLACSFTAGTFPAISRHFAGRDHTTVYHAFYKIAALRSSDREFDRRLRRLEEQLNEPAAPCPEIQLSFLIGPLFDHDFSGPQPTLTRVLATVYTSEGLLAARALLPGRSEGAIYTEANRLGFACAAPRVRLGSYQELSEEVWHLRKTEKLGFAAIGVMLGCCEAQASNAFFYAECIRAGHTPIERGPHGNLLDAGRQRLRVMLRKGWTHRKIQEWTGAPASMISRERKLYDQDLRTKGLAPLPPVGGGLRYSGAKIPTTVRREVERLYLEGFGTKNITVKTGVSNTHCLRTRTRLIKRLKRKGQCLPGCDADGKRRVFKEHLRHIPQASVDNMRALLLTGEVSILEAARQSIVSSASGYKIYHSLKRELEAKGEPMPAHNWRHGTRRDRARVQAALPTGQRWFIRHHVLMLEGMTSAEAQAQVRSEARLEQAEQMRPVLDLIAALAVECRRQVMIGRARFRGRSIEDQIRLIEQGKATLYTKRPMLPAEPMFSGAGSSLA